MALQLCGDLEEEARQRELATARATLQLGRRETTLEGLLELNGQLVTALQHYRALLEGIQHIERILTVHVCMLTVDLVFCSLLLTEKAVSLPPSLPPLQPLVSRHNSLSRQAERERRLPVAGRGLQVSSSLFAVPIYL